MNLNKNFRGFQMKIKVLIFLVLLTATMFANQLNMVGEVFTETW